MSTQFEWDLMEDTRGSMDRREDSIWDSIWESDREENEGVLYYTYALDVFLF